MRHHPATAATRLARAVFACLPPGKSLGFSLFLAMGPAATHAAEIPKASLTAAETQVPVFTDFQASAAPKTWNHPEALANFRLVLDFRLPSPDSQITVELKPAARFELPAGTGWRRLDLRYEHLPTGPALLEARINDSTLLDQSLPANDSPAADAPQARLPGGTPGRPIHLSLLTRNGAEIRQAWVQALDEAHHAALISSWNAESLEKGRAIYQSLCITCHGTPEREGSLPTSLRFGLQSFRNGSDPFRLYQTIRKGFGQMMPLPQYSPEETHAVIHYIRETYLAPLRPQDLSPVDAAYLASLPPGMRSLPATPRPKPSAPYYERMDFGPALHGTWQIAPGNIARKALACRLDPGSGGVSQGKAWILYDLDTLHTASVTHGTFSDWRGISYDGSHGTHASLTGNSLLTLPPGPGWANPADQSWQDPRPLGRDGLPYGPLPREWARHLGIHNHGPHTILHYSVGKAMVLDAAELPPGPDPAHGFIRTLNLSPCPHDLHHRLAPADAPLDLIIQSSPDARILLQDGFHTLHLPASSQARKIRIAIAPNHPPGLAKSLLETASIPLDLATLTQGGPPRWPESLTTQSIPGTPGDEAFTADTFDHPDDLRNPWQSRLQWSGIDFFADGHRAALCSWTGDVWIVEGIHLPAPAELRWRRIATGLFQPLGLKIINGIIHVTCRDQIARLHDHNGDGEIDFIECFNNDHQVTEHFHEFAMGLQADAAGNLYYAKSARHALPAIVPHHGTLLRVSADGSKTDILASGFRAANGVCLNPDGSFFVTDQEGHWMPKNRINRVLGQGPGEFHGNMMGYHPVTDPSDQAMRQPLCWITNDFDRSPAELLWVPADAAWGPLNGSLLNLSYGTGKIFIVPHQPLEPSWQGGVCELPLPAFPTGLHRGRFHPHDGQLYACGMFSWAGNRQEPGGFYRIRHTGKPALLPVSLSFRPGAIQIRFSEALHPEAAQAQRYSARTWRLQRSARYGSPHLDEKPLEITSARLTAPDTLLLEAPHLQPTMGLEIRGDLPHPDTGTPTPRVLHATIHQLGH